MEGFSLKLPTAPKHWVMEHDPRYFERIVREHDDSKRKEMKQDIALLYENELVGGVNPLMSRICRVCDLAFSKGAHRDKHLSTYEHRVKRNLSLGIAPPTNPNVCNICDLQFSTKGQLKRHLTTKEHCEKAKPVFYCDICE